MNHKLPWLLIGFLSIELNSLTADTEQARAGPPSGPRPTARPNEQSPADAAGSAAETAAEGAEDRPAGNEEDDAKQREAERVALRLRARLTRGPYLQLGTPHSVVVRWRTDRPSASLVRFGLSEKSLPFVARSQGALTEHVVLLTNLTPNTRYYYALSTNVLRGTNRLLVAGTNAFLTAPLPGTPKPAHIWVLGDPGTAKPPQKAVRDGFEKFNGHRHVDLWLMLGDNAYTSGKDAEYQGGIFLAYPEMLRTSVLWPALGNHDGGSSDSATQSGIYYDIFTLPTLGQAGGIMSGTEAYYSFDYANVHFICLDSHDSDRSTNGTMMRWLRADLAANAQPWNVAYWHHPPYSRGSHDTDSDKKEDISSREMRENFLPVLEAGGVDLVLCGHSHAYERSWWMDGHYGKSSSFDRSMVKTLGNGRPEEDGPYRKASLAPAPHQGTLYVVAGSSGQSSGVKGVHPAMQMALNVAGSLVLDFAGPRLDATFVDSQGEPRDTFTLLKGPNLPPLTGRELEEKIARGHLDELPQRLQPFFNLSNVPPPFVWLTNALPADQELLLKLYQKTADPGEKQRLTWALGAIGDGMIVTQFMGLLTNKIRDRALSIAEEDLRFVTVHALGLLAQRYEPPMALLRKGTSADWWYFRTNWISPRPLHLAAGALASCAFQALGHSGRPEALEILSKIKSKNLEYKVEEEDYARSFVPEFEQATNRLALFPKIGPAAWRRHVLSADLPVAKLE